MKLYQFVPFLICLFVTTGIFVEPTLFQEQVYATSPSFSRVVVSDPSKDWFDYGTPENFFGKESYNDISRVEYFSDGKTLNATLWMAGVPPEEIESSNFTVDHLRYGMYIDSDSDIKTGNLGGVDYTFDISKEQHSQGWDMSISEWSTNMSGRVLKHDSNHPVKYNESYGGSNEGFVELSADLRFLGYPDKYRVIFYSIIEGNKPGNNFLKVGDFTKWVLIPPPKVLISLSPNPAEIKRGEDKNAQILIRPSTGFETQSRIWMERPMLDNITLNSTSFPFIETQDEISTMPIKVPTSGALVVPIRIQVPLTTEIRPHTLPLHVVSSFPAELFHANEFKKIHGLGNFTQDIPTAEAIDLNETSDLTVIVQKEIGLSEQFASFFKDWGLIVGLVIGGATSQAWTWAFDRIRKKGKIGSNH